MTFFRKLRTNATVTVVTLIVNLQILNTSVDPVDHTYGYDDLSVNEIESYVELVLEHLLQHNDAVSETNDHDSSKKPITRIVYIFNDHAGLVKNNTFQLLPETIFGEIPCTLLSRAVPIVAPPPKA